MRSIACGHDRVAGKRCTPFDDSRHGPFPRPGCHNRSVSDESVAGDEVKKSPRKRLPTPICRIPAYASRKKKKTWGAAIDTIKQYIPGLGSIKDEGAWGEFPIEPIEYGLDPIVEESWDTDSSPKPTKNRNDKKPKAASRGSGASFNPDEENGEPIVEECALTPMEWSTELRDHRRRKPKPAVNDDGKKPKDSSHGSGRSFNPDGKSGYSMPDAPPLTDRNPESDKEGGNEKAGVGHFRTGGFYGKVVVEQFYPVGDSKQVLVVKPTSRGKCDRPLGDIRQLKWEREKMAETQLDSEMAQSMCTRSPTVTQARFSRRELRPMPWIPGEKTEIVETEIVVPGQDDDELNAGDLSSTAGNILGEEDIVFRWNDERSGGSVSRESNGRGEPTRENTGTDVLMAGV